MQIQTSLAGVRMLEREMTAAGERLKLAIAVENDFNRVNPKEDANLRKQWIQCRRIVDQFAEDYVTAVQRWRQAVTVSVGLECVPHRGTGKASSATMFHRILGRPLP